MKLLLFIFLALCKNLSAQVNIKGVVTNRNKKVISGATITVYKINPTETISYTITNGKGEFSLTISEQTISFNLEVSHVGYTTLFKKIPNKIEFLNISLNEEEINLPEIKVRQTIPISKKGDTITYHVNNFKIKSDKVIADVIKKLPGIVVESNGQIKYNGRPISHYYIENLDLLQSRYNIANQNISADLVDDVQILENHQPIKILDSSVIPNTAALNIRLNSKAKNKVFVSSKLGIGGTPFLWNTEIIGFNFRKKFQSIAGIKSNNIGLNLDYELHSLYASSSSPNTIISNTIPGLLSLAVISPPPFDTRRTLFNKSFLTYYNALAVLNNGAQLRTNISYYNNKTDIAANSKLSYFLVNDSFIVRENNFQNRKASKINADFSYIINKKKIYLKQNLTVDLNLNKHSGTIINPSNVDQLLRINNSAFKNNFQIILPAKKSKIEFNSDTYLTFTPQSLTVEPGNINGLNNASISVEAINQKINSNSFRVDNYLSFYKKIFGINNRVKTGLNYSNDKLISSIQEIEGGVHLSLPDSLKNNLRSGNLNLYTEITSSFFKGDFNIEFTSRLENIIFKTSNITYTKTSNNYLFFNNSFSIRKDLGSFYNLSISANMENSINDFSQNTTGYILTSYRKISRNISSIQINKKKSVNLFLTYRNTIKTFFAYLTSTYSLVNSNLIDDILFYKNLESKRSINQTNNTNSFIVISSISKYINPIKSSISVINHLSFTKYPQIQNGVLSYVKSKFLATTVNLNSRVFDWVFPEYYFTFNRGLFDLNSMNSSFSKQAVLQTNQGIKLNFFLSSNLIAKSEASFYSSKNADLKTHYCFVDCGLEMKRGKHTFELSGFNLTNLNRASNFIILQNSEIYIDYKLRPINILFSYHVGL